MATITLNLDERTIKNGMAQVRIRISHRGSNCFIGTGVYVEPQYFQPDTLHDAVHRKAQMATDKRVRISEQVQRIEDYLDDVDRVELATMTANDIRDRAGVGRTKSEANSVGRCVSIRHTNRVANKNTSGDFLRWFDEFGESRRTAKTQESYAYGANVLRAYCESLHLQTLTFSDIDYARLADFARWLTSTGKAPSTRHMLESYVRAAYKEAQRRHMISREHDPYLDYSIRPIPTKEIECLTREEMRALMTADLKKKGHQWARDMALASFYLCGANLLDLYEMPKELKGEAVFVRHKVDGHWQIPQHIRIEPELRALIDRYGSDTHLLHFKGLYANYDTFRHKISHRLEEISDEIGFKVNMAKVRRTWATLAGELECPEVVIDRSMGHVAKTVNGRFYEKYDWSRTAKWNRRVIDYVLAQNPIS